MSWIRPSTKRKLLRGYLIVVTLVVVIESLTLWLQRR